MDFSSHNVRGWLDGLLDKVVVYKKQVVVGAVVVVGIGVGGISFAWYQHYVRAQAHKAFVFALRYYDGVVSADARKVPDQDVVRFSSEHEKWEKTENAFKEGYQRYKSTELAPMFLAFQSEALANLGKHDEAIQVLADAQVVMRNDEIRDFYQVKLALMKMDSKNDHTRQQGLVELKKHADNARSFAHELALYHLGGYLWQEKKFADAKNYWQQLLVKYGTRDVKNPSVFADVVKEKLALVSVESL